MRLYGFCVTLATLALFTACREDPASPEAGLPTALQPARIEILGGNNQIGTVGIELSVPITLRVLTESNRPVSGARVRFYLTDGSVERAMGTSNTMTTDEDGIVWSRWYLGTNAGVQQLTVVALGDETVYTVVKAQARAGAPARLIAQRARSLQVGPTERSNVAVIVEDQWGNLVPEQVLTWSTTGGELEATTTLTDARGYAENTWVSRGALSGIIELRAGPSYWIRFYRWVETTEPWDARLFVGTWDQWRWEFYQDSAMTRVVDIVTTGVSALVEMSSEGWNPVSYAYRADYGGAPAEGPGADRIAGFLEVGQGELTAQVEKVNTRYECGWLTCEGPMSGPMRFRISGDTLTLESLSPVGAYVEGWYDWGYYWTRVVFHRRPVPLDP